MVRGDSAQELLQKQSAAIDLVAYSGVDAMVRDAVAGHLKVFVADVPVARFYLARTTGGDAFRQSGNIALNPMFMAVRKGNQKLLGTVQAGLDRLSASDIDAIVSEWSGTPAVNAAPWRVTALILVAVASLSVAALLWNLLLRRRITAVTRDIREKNHQLALSHEAIRLNEKKFRLIFENAPYAITINDLKDGTFLDANKAFLKSHNIDKSDLFRLKTPDIMRISEPDLATVLETLLEKGSIENIEAVVQRPDGSTAHVVYSSVLMDFDGQPQALSMVVDVTEKMKAREALRESEKKFRDIFNTAPIGIFRTTYGGRLIEANDTMAKMLGYENRDQILAVIKDLATDIYPSPAERQRFLDALIQSPQGVRMDIEFIRRDGTPLYAVINASLQMDDAGRPAYINGTFEDITSLKEAEVELRRLAAAVEQSGEIIVVTDPHGVVQYVNRAFEDSTGYSRFEVIGHKPSILKSGEHDLEFYADLWRTISGGQTWSGRLVNKRKDGAKFVEEATISPVFDGKGHIVNYVAAKRDITEDLEREDQYRQMQKMEAIGQLTGGVAHDFNNLLQAISGYTNLAIMELEAEHRSRTYLEQAAKAGQRATALVRQLLLFSRRQVMRPTLLNLNTTVADMLKMLGRIIGEHIRLQWHPHKEPCIIRGDTGMLDQVLMNLCVNARDAMPEGGLLSIETRTVQIDSDFCRDHAWASPGRFVLLSVTDTGCGMDRKTLEHIFEPFFTTKEEGKGTGLGLATLYGIVKQHNGLIDVHSEPGKGTSFRVYLPLCEREETSVPVEAVREAAGGSETILLAEDEEVVRDLASTILKRAGYTVLEAENGEQAVSLFEEHSENISLLILDVIMPELDGQQAFERVSAIKPDIAALFSSGYSKDTMHNKFVLPEGKSLIQKPYTPNALLLAVRKALDAASPE